MIPSLSKHVKVEVYNDDEDINDTFCSHLTPQEIEEILVLRNLSNILLN